MVSLPNQLSCQTEVVVIYNETVESVDWTRVVLAVKSLPASVGDAREVSSIPGSGRSPEDGNGNPLQYSCLENFMDRGAWWAIVHEVTKSWTRLRDSHFHFHFSVVGLFALDHPLCRVGSVSAFIILHLWCLEQCLMPVKNPANSCWMILKKCWSQCRNLEILTSHRHVLSHQIFRRHPLSVRLWSGTVSLHLSQGFYVSVATYLSILLLFSC